jgi:hypothetical protein
MPLNRLQKKITEGQDAQRDKQPECDAADPDCHTPALKHQRKHDARQHNDNPSIWPQECTNQL